jgi:hypothetical protein
MLRCAVMRLRIALSAASALILTTLLAPAQPKRGAKPDSDSKPSTTEKSAEKTDKSEGEKKPADSADEPAESSPKTGASDDLGEPPPKRADPGADPRTRTSPLTPEPNEFPEGAAKPAPIDYDRLLGDIAALRSRVAALTTTLFASKLRVVVEVDDGDAARIAGFSVTLDDGVVYAAPTQFSASEGKVVYEHAVSPGHHLLGIEIERYDAQNREYKSWQASKFSIVVPESQLVEAEVRMADDSSMAEDFPSDKDGEYDLRVRLRARVID